MNDDAISRHAVLKLLYALPPEEAITKAMLIQSVNQMDAAQPEEASMILGKSKDGVRLWYQCSACGEPVADADDNYCRNCGRKFING